MERLFCQELLHESRLPLLGCECACLHDKSPFFSIHRPSPTSISHWRDAFPHVRLPSMTASPVGTMLCPRANHARHLRREMLALDPLSGRTSIAHGARIFVPINSDRAFPASRVTAPRRPLRRRLAEEKSRLQGRSVRRCAGHTVQPPANHNCTMLVASSGATGTGRLCGGRSGTRAPMWSGILTREPVTL